MSDSVQSNNGSQPVVEDLMVNLRGVVAAIAGTMTPPPAAGSVAAAVGALAAALAQMVAGLTTGRRKYAAVADEMRGAARRAAALSSELASLVERDAAAYGAVAEAYGLPKNTETDVTTRQGEIQRAMLSATESPLAIARASAAVAVLSADIAERGNTNAVADAAVATLLADAVCRAAALTVRVNVAALADATTGQRLADEAAEFTKSASEALARALNAVAHHA